MYYVLSTLFVIEVFLIVSGFLGRVGTEGIGLIGTLLLFFKSKIVGVLSASFLKAVVYVCEIWILEKHFGSIAKGSRSCPLY